MSAPGNHKKVCVVAGVGPGNGAAFVRRFAAEGHRVAMIARSRDVMDGLAGDHPEAHGYTCDLGDTTSVTRTFAAIAAGLGPVDTLIYNGGKGVWGGIDAVSPEDFESCWRAHTLGGYTAARALIPSMKARGAGQIIFIGATASRRGGTASIAFASAKAAQRSVAESWRAPMAATASTFLSSSSTASSMSRLRAPAFRTGPRAFSWRLPMSPRWP